MSEHQHAGDDTRPELQFFQQRRPFPHSAAAAFPFARHIDRKRMGITASLALPDPAAASLVCSLSSAQLYPGLPWLPEAIAEVPAPTAAGWNRDGTVS